MFTHGVKIKDLNDFLNPEQECVVQITHTKPQPPKPDLIKLRKHPQNSNSKKGDDEAQDQAKTAQVTLNDCLACSGCVTTSEVIFLQEHSIETFLSNVKKYKFSAISISSQSLDFLATLYNLPPHRLLRQLCWSLKSSLGISCVLDQSAIDALLLIETYRELCWRRENHESSSVLITSHCPGWICFAEKTQPKTTIELLSRLKTSQQILGHLLKTLTRDCYNFKSFCRSRNTLWSPSFKTNFELLQSRDIYHVTVEPCYDKKLESFREATFLEAHTKIAMSLENQVYKSGCQSSEHHSGVHESADKNSGQSSILDVSVLPSTNSPNAQSSNDNVKEVDLVLSTHEFIQMLDSVLKFCPSQELRVHEITPDNLFLGCQKELNLVFPSFKKTSFDPFLLGLQHETIKCQNIIPDEHGDITQQRHFQTATHDEITQNGCFPSEILSHPSPYCLCCHTLRWGLESLATTTSGCFMDFCYRQSWIHNVLLDEQAGSLINDESLSRRKKIIAENLLDLKHAVPLSSKNRRPYSEAHLEVEGQNLQWIMAYGLQNIQNIVQFISNSSFSKNSITFIELMACPRGCIKGGGQRVPVDSPLKSSELRHLSTNSDTLLTFPQFHPALPFIYKYISMTERNQHLDSTSMQHKALLLNDQEIVSTDKKSSLEVPASWLRTEFQSQIETLNKNPDVISLSALRW